MRLDVTRARTRQIETELQSGVRQHVLAKKYGVSRSRIQQIDAARKRPRVHWCPVLSHPFECWEADSLGQSHPAGSRVQRIIELWRSGIREIAVIRATVYPTGPDDNAWMIGWCNDEVRRTIERWCFRVVAIAKERGWLEPPAPRDWTTPGRVIDMGGPRDQWIEGDPWTA
jgi:hypothetical protein